MTTGGRVLYPDAPTLRSLAAGADCGPYTGLVRAMAGELLALRADIHNLTIILGVYRAHHAQRHAHCNIDGPITPPRGGR